MKGLLIILVATLIVVEAAVPCSSRSQRVNNVDETKPGPDNDDYQQVNSTEQDDDYESNEDDEYPSSTDYESEQENPRQNSDEFGNSEDEEDRNSTDDEREQENSRQNSDEFENSEDEEDPISTDYESEQESPTQNSDKFESREDKEDPESKNKGCESLGFKPDPKDCTKFTRSESMGGKLFVHRFNCGPGTAFKLSSCTCDFRYKVKC